MASSQLKVGAVLNYVVLGLNSLVGLLYTPYMLRMMGQSEYGLYSLVASFIAYLMIMDFGFGNAIIRYTAKFRAENKIYEQYSMYGMFLILYSIIGLIALGVGVGLYLHIDAFSGTAMTELELSRAKILMIILSFNLAVTFPFGLFGSIITAYEKFTFLKTVQIFRVVLSTLVMVGLLKYGYRAIGIAVAQTVFNISTLLFHFLYCKYKIKIKILFGRFQWGFLKEVAIYSFWVFLNFMMDRLYWNTGQFVLGTVVGTVAVSVFSVAILLNHMYMSLSTAISGVFLPYVTIMTVKQRKDKDISDLFIKTGRIQFLVLAYFLSCFILFGSQFIAIWAGNGYKDAYLMTLLFLLASTPPMIQNLGITILNARNQMKFQSLLCVTIAMVSFLAQIFLSRHYGGLGCAVAISGALLVGQGIIMNIYYCKAQNLDIPRFWKEIAKMSVTPIVLTVAGWFVLKHIDMSDWAKFAQIVFLYSLIYISLFWMTGMYGYERKLIYDPIKKLVGKFRA